MFRLRWPTQYDGVTQPFGAHPENYRMYGLPAHAGIDLRAPNGSQIFACADGTVSEVHLDGNADKQNLPYGNQVRIVHEAGEGVFTTVYAHLQEVRVSVGDQVRGGECIGLADDTGRSFGAHLHLMLKKKGASAARETAYPYDIVDPIPYLDPFPGADGEPLIQEDYLVYQADVTIPDGSPKHPGEQFVKTWRVLNTGTTIWGSGYMLAFWEDEQMGAPSAVPLPPARPGEAVHVSVTLTAPDTIGFHRSTWKAKNPTGDDFGQILFALIRVPPVDEPQPLNAIVDLSHHNTITDWQAVRNDGIVAIIHKATQGTSFIDSRYEERRETALGLGLMWGAYHFGEGGDPAAQAQHFLNVAQPDARTLLALDFERNPNGRSMNLIEAEEFAQNIFNATGRWPLLYTGRWYIQQFIRDDQPTKLSNCPLWIASWTEEPVLPAQWLAWTIWQYTNGVDGPEPHSVRGIIRCDRDQFNGTLDDLRRLWGIV